MCHNDPNNMTPLPLPTPCHMHDSQDFDKIDSFLKPVLNICILGNLGEVSGLLKRGSVFCVKSTDLVDMLIFGKVGFIKVCVGII